MGRLFEFGRGATYTRGGDEEHNAAVQMRWSRFGHRRPVPTPENAARLAADNEASIARVKRERAPEGWRPW